MAIKKNTISMLVHDDPFLEQGYNANNVERFEKNILNENTYYRSEEFIEINSTDFSFFDSITFGEFTSRVPKANTVIKYFILAPSNLKSDTVNNSDFKSLTYQVSSDYNYYAPQYEESVVGVGELQLRNIYTSTSELKNRELFYKTKQNGDYYDFLMNAPEHKFIVFPQQYDFSQINTDKVVYPYGVDLRIAVDNRNNKLKKFLLDTDFYNSFVKSYLNYPKKSEFYQNFAYRSDTGAQSVQKEMLTVDMLNLNSSFYTPQATEVGQHYVGEQNPESLYGLYLKSGLLKGFFRQLLREEILSYKDLLTGQMGYSETVFYKIEKSLGESPNSPIQTFIIPADSSEIKYYDTQIKHGVEYSYKITACCLVVGNEYQYSNDFGYNQKEGKVSFSLENRAVIRIVETPIAQETVVCMPSPPARPQVDFYTKNNADNRIYIRLFPYNTDTIVEPFLEIEETDYILKNMLGKKNKFADSHLFENKNNKIVSYDIFKTKVPPQELSDFSKRKIATVENNAISNSFTYSAKIRPNEKCYYMFRAQNQHGLKSNPSIVFEVELIRGSSTSRIVVKSYKFPKRSEIERSKKMKSILQLIPSSQHTIVSEQVEANLNSYKKEIDKIVIGEAEYPIWGKKFKIRVTSNNTGRKIDFNVLFNLIKKKTKEEMI